MKTVFLVLLAGFNAWAQNEVKDTEALIKSKLEGIKTAFVGYNHQHHSQQQTDALYAKLNALASETGLERQDIWNLANVSKWTRDDDLLVLMGTALVLENKVSDRDESKAFDYPQMRAAMAAYTRLPDLKGDIRKYNRELSEGKNIELTQEKMLDAMNRIVRSAPERDFREIRTIEGEYFRNAKVTVAATLDAHQIPQLASEAAQKFCEEEGFSYRTAFYWEKQGHDVVVSDVFCSENLYHSNADARSIIISSRRSRGLKIPEDGEAVVDSYRKINVRGYKLTDLSGVGLNAGARGAAPITGRP